MGYYHLQICSHLHNVSLERYNVRKLTLASSARGLETGEDFSLCALFKLLNYVNIVLFKIFS